MGLIAAALGFMGMKNVKNDPAHYGGKTLAMIGMIAGILSVVVAIAYFAFLFLFGGLGMLMQMANQAR
jgi:hypothetical protein